MLHLKGRKNESVKQHFYNRERMNEINQHMIEGIFKTSKTDAQLSGLLDEVKEFAQVYLLARQRQKGCDGMGELATMKEEFRDVVDKVIQYCQEKKYISRDLSFDIDAIADKILRV